MTDEYDPTGTVSRLTGIPIKTLRRWCEADDSRVLGAIRPGREWLIPRARLRDLKALGQARIFDPDQTKALRESAGVSLREAAEKLNIDQRTLRRWERGSFLPSWEEALPYKQLRDRWAAKIRRSTTTKSQEGK